MEDDLLQGFNFSSSSSSSSSDSETPPSSRHAKLHQSEASFQNEKQLWKPICQSQQAAKRQQLYKSTDHRLAPVSREEALELKAAAEERYYSRDYERALELAGRALALASSGEGLLVPVERRDMVRLRERCCELLGKEVVC